MTLIEKLLANYDNYMEFQLVEMKKKDSYELALVSTELLKNSCEGIRSILLSNVFGEKSVVERKTLLDELIKLGFTVHVLKLKKDNIPCVDYRVSW